MLTALKLGVPLEYTIDDISQVTLWKSDQETRKTGVFFDKKSVKRTN